MDTFFPYKDNLLTLKSTPIVDSSSLIILSVKDWRKVVFPVPEFPTIIYLKYKELIKINIIFTHYPSLNIINFIIIYFYKKIQLFFLEWIKK